MYDKSQKCVMAAQKLRYDYQAKAALKYNSALASRAKSIDDIIVAIPCIVLSAKLENENTYLQVNSEAGVEQISIGMKTAIKPDDRIIAYIAKGKVVREKMFTDPCRGDIEIYARQKTSWMNRFFDEKLGCEPECREYIVERDLTASEKAYRIEIVIDERITTTYLNRKPKIEDIKQRKNTK
jgi:hypothetical protein